MKKGIKKYYPGVSGLTTSSTGALTNPNAFSTGKFLFPQQKTLGNIVDNKVMSQDYLDKAKPSFMDKAGSLMKGMDVGGMASSLGGSIAMLIKANRKKDPNPEVPYKNGTNMIKYQGNKPNTKTNKSKFIKYQEGNEYLQSGKGMSNVLNAMEENNKNLSNASIKPEQFDMSSLNDYMPDIPQRQSPQPIKVGPSRKEMAKLMKEYNKKEFQAGRFGNMDKSDPRYKQLATRNEANKARGEYEKLYSQNENDYKKLKNNYKESEPLSTKTPLLNLKLAQSAELPSNLNKIPVKEQSRREKRAENKKLEGMAKAPITYNENSFVGPPQFVGPSDQELQLGRTRENAQEAEDQYDSDMRLKEKARLRNEAKIKSAIASGVPASINAPTFSKESIQRNMEKQAGGPVSTEKNPILYKEPVNKAGSVSFKNMTPAQQKQYRAGIASGNKFTVEGIGEYGAATKQEQAQSTRIAAKGGSKPTVKGNTPKGPFFKDGVAINNFKDPATGRRYFTNNRIFDEKTGTMGKYTYDEKTNKVMTQWDKKSAQNSKTMPGYKPSKPIYEFDTVVKDTQQNNKGVQKPTQTPAQIDSALNSIKLPKFKNKNTLHPLEYSSKK